MKKVQVLVFLYNGKQYISKIQNEFAKQVVKDVEISLKYILTETGDCSKDELDKISADYAIVMPSEFSHSLTRQ